MALYVTRVLPPYSATSFGGGTQTNGDNAMAFQAVPDGAEIVIQYLVNLQVMKNVLHAFKPGGYNLTDLTTLATIVDANVATAWLPDQTLDAAYINTTVRGLAAENDQEVSVNASAGVGLLATQALPGNVTLAIKKTSGLTGRSARGRVYWIGLAREQLDTNENFTTIAAKDAIVANVNSMRGSISGTVWTAAIVSRFLNGVKRATGVTFEWTGTEAVNTAIDSQRRRLTR